LISLEVQHKGSWRTRAKGRWCQWVDIWDIVIHHES